MTEPQVRALFNQIADDEPGEPRVDTELALRRGRARLRWRRAWAAGVPVLAVAVAAAVAIAVSANPFQPGNSSPATASGPPAPSQFNPLMPQVSFGWLPAGQSLTSAGFDTSAVTLDTSSWDVSVYARDQCRLNHSASGVICPHWSDPPLTPFGERAPDVNGHAAYWVGGPGLIWQYAAGGWGWLIVPGGSLKQLLQNKSLQDTAIKIASNVRIGSPTLRVGFPAQLTGMPGQWRINNLYYLPDAGMLRANSYVLTTSTSTFLPHVGDLGVWTNAPYIDVETNHTGCDAHDPTETINGVKVVIGHSTVGHGVAEQNLCARADGLSLGIEEFGSHLTMDVATVFKHMRLLGTDPANWASSPVG